MKGAKKKMWIEKLLIPALLAVVTALCSYMVNALNESKKVNNANAKGTMLMLRRQLISDHKKFCVRGETMTHFDFEDITEIHSAYKALGGNGLTDKMYSELKDVSIGEEK